MDEHLKFQLHPWHGVSIGEKAPEVCTSFIEIVPTDTIKYEVDKASGILKVDRPQQFSNVFPALYGFLPQTFCDIEVGKLCMEKTGKTGIIGDQDPLDIIVLTEKIIARGGILVQAIPIGGFRMIDQNQADDKIIAIMKGDEVYGSWKDLSDVNEAILTRLKHYFLTYKKNPDETANRVEIDGIYGREEAYEVIRRSQTDYQNKFLLT
ncbi:MAG: Inorganic diphosphatase [Bacteroidetes bacterium]|nr:Inorganic diphosphatase [Bacteroidota bacterium]